MLSIDKRKLLLTYEAVVDFWIDPNRPLRFLNLIHPKQVERDFQILLIQLLIFGRLGLPFCPQPLIFFNKTGHIESNLNLYLFHFELRMLEQYRELVV